MNSLLSLSEAVFSSVRREKPYVTTLGSLSRFKEIVKDAIQLRA